MPEENSTPTPTNPPAPGGIGLQYPDNITNYGANNGAQVSSVWFTVYVRELSREGQAIPSAERASRVATSDNRIAINNQTLSNAFKTTATLAGGLTTAKTFFDNPIAGAGTIIGLFGASQAYDAFLGPGAAAAKIEELGAEADRVFQNIVNSTLRTNNVLKTDQIIQLHMPQSVQEQYNAGWSDVEFGLMGKYASGGNSLLDDAKAVLSGAEQGAAARERGVRYLLGISNIANAAGFNFRLQDIADLATGKIPNPYKEQLFKSMNFRTFAFQYKFVPKSRRELNNVFNIINTFRKHMHPERQADGFFIMYPSEFKIEYFYKSGPNKWLAKVANCALVDMKVDYGSGGAFTTIRGQDGAPSEITMTLQFKELELLTREHFENFNPRASDDDEEVAPANTSEDDTEAGDREANAENVIVSEQESN
jgi:hypothetical protein